MPDIFNRTTDAFGGSFAADSATITFPALINNGGAEAGMLVQNLSCSYQQQVTRLFEVGSPNIYYVGGRTAGQSSIARVIGPRKMAREFYQTYGDVCNAKTNTLQFAAVAGCGTLQGARAAFVCKFVVIVQIGFTVTAADMMINESMAMIFSSFLYQ
jgi:hypothetical protein